MADKFWEHLKLKNGDKVRFVPPAPDGERLGGVTQQEREDIGHVKTEISDYDERITDLENRPVTDPTLELRVEKLEAAAEGNLYMFREDAAEAYDKAVPADALKWATLDAVGGKTLVWNQMFPVWVGTHTSGGITSKNNGDGSQTITGTTNGSAWCAVHFGMPVSSHSFIVANHKYLIAGISGHGFLVNSGVWIYASIHGASFTTASDVIFTPTNTNNNFDIYVRSTETGIEINETLHLMLFDLTAMFGAGNEPTAEQFRAMFPADYYPYSEPTLMTYSPETVVSRGRNLVDSEGFVHGDLSASKGTVNTAQSYVTTDFLPIHGGATHIRARARVICFYDSSKAYISGVNVASIPDGNTTVPSNAAYFRFTSPDTSFDGCYLGIGKPTPFFKNVYPMYAITHKYFPNGMRSAGDVHDSIEVDDDGKVWAVQRVNQLTFDGSEVGWMKSQSYQGCYYIIGNGMPGSPFNGFLLKQGTRNLICDRYIRASGADEYSQKQGYMLADYTIGFNYGANVALDEWKAHLASKPLSVGYELAEPIRTIVTEPFPSDLLVEAGGTLTFENQHGDDYRVPLPNQETWMIKLGGAAQ